MPTLKPTKIQYSLFSKSNSNLELIKISLDTQEMNYLNFYNSEKKIETAIKNCIQYCNNKDNFKNQRRFIYVSGIASSGKTTFIKCLTSNLISTLYKSSFILLTQDSLFKLDEPEYISLLAKETSGFDIVYLIIDSIFEQKTCKKFDNLSRGLFFSLFPNLRFIVCTNLELNANQLNTNVIEKFEFQPIPVSQAQKLITESVPKFDKTTIRSPMTLGQIYETIEKESNK